MKTSGFPARRPVVGPSAVGQIADRSELSYPELLRPFPGARRCGLGALAVTVVSAALWMGGVGVVGALTEDDGATAATPPSIAVGHLSGIGLLVATFLGFWLVFRRSPAQLSSVAGRLRWTWLAQCALMALPVMAGLSLIDVWHSHADLAWRPWSLLLCVVGLVLVPVQAAAEEYFGRGLVSQVVATWFSHERVGLVASCVLSSAAFSALHASSNPWSTVYFFGLGVVAWWITYRTGGLESAIALHVVNNVTLTLVQEPWLNYEAASTNADSSGSPWLLVGLGVWVLLAVVMDRVLRRHPTEADCSVGWPVAGASPDADPPPYDSGESQREALMLHTAPTDPGQP